MRQKVKSNFISFPARMEAEMPTSVDLKSGDFSLITPGHRTALPPPQEEGDETSSPSPSNRLPRPQIDFNRTTNVHLNLTKGKREEDILRPPKTS